MEDRPRQTDRQRETRRQNTGRSKESGSMDTNPTDWKERQTKKGAENQNKLT